MASGYTSQVGHFNTIYRGFNTTSALIHAISTRIRATLTPRNTISTPDQPCLLPYSILSLVTAAIGDDIVLESTLLIAKPPRTGQSNPILMPAERHFDAILTPF